MCSIIRREEIEGAEGEALAGGVGEFLVVLDPEVEEAVEVDQGDFAVFLGAGFLLGVAGKAAGGDEEADVVIAQDGEEGAQAIDAGGGVEAFDLDLDARRAGAEGIGPGEDIDAAVFAGRGDPGDVVAHGAEEIGDELLEIVGRHFPQVVLDLGPGLFLGFFKGDAGFFAGGFVFFLELGGAGGEGFGGFRLGLFPLPVEDAGGLEKVLGLGVTPEGFAASFGNEPDALAFDQPAGFDGGDAGEADDFFEALGAGIVGAEFVVGG